VTTSSRKNYNINTLRGMTNDDDMDVCETLGLDTSLAYTPDIIQAQLDRDVDPSLHKEILNEVKKYI
jgi:hypothetical protein